MDYSRPWCIAHDGVPEVVLDNGTRADCITTYYAIEMDYAHKWRQAVGQSLSYAAQTGLQPGIVLIVGDDDARYVRRLHRVIRAYNLPIQVWTVAK